MAYNIHIKTPDGVVIYPNADDYKILNNVLIILTSFDGDEIRFSPHYWQTYVVNPKTQDPLGVGTL